MIRLVTSMQLHATRSQNDLCCSQPEQNLNIQLSGWLRYSHHPNWSYWERHITGQERCHHMILMCWVPTHKISPWWLNLMMTQFSDAYKHNQRSIVNLHDCMSELQLHLVEFHLIFSYEYHLMTCNKYCQSEDFIDSSASIFVLDHHLF